MARVLFIEPFYTGSHRAFADGLARHSRHEIELLSLSGGQWRKRMRRGAIELAAKLDELPGLFDLLIATDMLDLPLFLALARTRLRDIPVLYYLHENQLTYPRLEETKLNSWFGQVNYASAIVADAVAFNSEFHRSDFLGALRKLENQPTNWLEQGTIEGIAAKAQVLPVGVDLAPFDALRLPLDAVPLLLWNHRWEFDKSPAMFARAVVRLAERWEGFNVAIAGDPGDNPHAALGELRERLGSRVLQLGRLDRWEDYARLLWRSKVVVSTARQEFFGISIVEAMYCETVPIAPRRLNYPALIPASQHHTCLFDDEEGLVERIEHALRTESPGTFFRDAASRWEWRQIAPSWDSTVDAFIDRR